MSKKLKDFLILSAMLAAVFVLAAVFPLDPVEEYWMRDDPKGMLIGAVIAYAAFLTAVWLKMGQEGIF